MKKTFCLLCLLTGCSTNDSAPADFGYEDQLTVWDFNQTADCTQVPDLARLPDLATPDLTRPRDFTATPDLTRLPDLTTLDLSPYPDLAIPDLATPDLATPDLTPEPDLMVCGKRSTSCCSGPDGPRTVCEANLLCYGFECQCGGEGLPCCDGTSCHGQSLTCIAGTCTTCGGLNDPCCNNSTTVGCFQPLACRGGQCVVCVAAQGTCKTSDDCCGQYCDPYGNCNSVPPAGYPCTDHPTWCAILPGGLHGSGCVKGVCCALPGSIFCSPTIPCCTG